MRRNNQKGTFESDRMVEVLKEVKPLIVRVKAKGVKELKRPIHVQK